MQRARIFATIANLDRIAYVGTFALKGAKDCVASICPNALLCDAVRIVSK